jgi:superoxide oxidase
MQLANSAERYGAISRALHWLTALFVVVAWILGIMNDAFPKGESRTAALFFHISVGLTIVDLVIMRML